MQALFYTGAAQMQHRTAPLPTPTSGDRLLKILYCGICGSDRHAYHGKDPRRIPPLILGHEAVGEDENGARHIVNPLITCGACPACRAGRANLCPRRELIGMARPGAFADYLAIPSTNLLPLPPQLPPAAAALTEPAACAWHAAALAARHSPVPPPLARAVIIGAGAIGLLSALALRILGCRLPHISDTQRTRLDTAEKLALAPLDAADTTKHAGTADIVIDAVGARATRAAASALASPGGVIIHIGLEQDRDGLDTRRLTLQEITFIGVYTYTATEFTAAAHLLAAGAFGDTSQFCETRPLSQGAQAFADLDNGHTAAKLLLHP